jgi:hypothetical protein
VGEAVDVDVEEARGWGCCWDVLVVGGWGGRGALFGGEEDVGVGVGFEILGGWRAGRVADGVRHAVVRWWSGGVNLQMLLVGWIVGHCGMFDSMLQVNLGIAYDEVVKAVDEVEIPVQAA